MSAALASKEPGFESPNLLKDAQAAMQHADVQEMLRRLSAYQLGVFMPHMHAADTGEFQTLPATLTQLESGLCVSFQSSQQIAAQPNRYAPVAWVWRDGSMAVASACEMVQDAAPGTGSTIEKHKM